VKERYYHLAANNRSHFLNPNKGDTKRSTKNKVDDKYKHGVWTKNDMGVITSYKVEKLPSGAPGYYRAGHVEALSEAMIAAREKRSIDTAMAAEAFANHYLTDMFAGGHTRTVRASITEYWNARVPMFFHNFKGLMAEKIAYYIDSHNGRGVVSVDFIKDKAKATLNNKIAANGMPAFTFGDLVSSAVHDYDNKNGVDVTVNGKSKTLRGDGHLGEGDEKASAIAAVRAGVHDVERAYSIAKAGGTVVDVINALLHDGLFAPENYIKECLAPFGGSRKTCR